MMFLLSSLQFFLINLNNSYFRDLPHSLVKDTSEICLIVGDLDKRNHRAEIEPDILHYKELLRKHGVTRVSQVSVRWFAEKFSC